jgi:hypothetical protein
VTNIEITVAKGEDERRGQASLVNSIAHEVFEYADERVGHAEGVSKDELMLACYHRLGDLLAQWGKKLDRLEKISEEPAWLKTFAKNKESNDGMPLIAYDSVSLGFPVDNLFFAKEKGGNTLSDDLLLVSETSTMLMEDFKDLVAFCEKNGLDFYVDGFNTKQPGRTFRVALYRPKLATRSRLEFREKSIKALEIFNKLSKGNSVSVARRALMESLIETGDYDELLASKVVNVLVSSGQIPKTLLK